MAKMTPEDRKKLPPGLYVSIKCDHCGKPIMSCLSYRGVNNNLEYCSNSCFEAGEGGTRGKIQVQKGAETMIEKTNTDAPAKPGKDLKNKAVGPKADKSAEPVKKLKEKTTPEPEAEEEAAAPKKLKKKVPSTEAAAPVKKLKKKVAPEPEAEPAKKLKKKVAPESEAEEAPAKKKKAAPADAAPAKKAKAKKDATPKETPYRAGSAFEGGFKRLMSGKAMTLEAMFEGTGANDPSRMVSHMIRRGDESGEFTIVRQEDGKVKMTKVYGK